VHHQRQPPILRVGVDHFGLALGKLLSQAHVFFLLYLDFSPTFITGTRH
jgi:hypothetical protein